MSLGRIFERLRDNAYNFVSKEGGFTLHFFSDFIRGHTLSDSEKTSSFKKIETPLNYKERKVFNELLARKTGESQIDYWKRKKAMQSMDDKKGFVAEEIERRKMQAQNDKRDQDIKAIQEQRALEMQRKRIEQAKYASTRQMKI